MNDIGFLIDDELWSPYIKDAKGGNSNGRTAAFSRKFQQWTSGKKKKKTVQIINDLLQMTEIPHRAAGSDASP